MSDARSSVAPLAVTMTIRDVRQQLPERLPDRVLAAPSADIDDHGHDGADTEGGPEDVEVTHIPRARWTRTYRRAVMILDAVVLVIAVMTAEFVRIDLDVTIGSQVSTAYTVLGLVIATLWWTVLQLYGATDSRILGDGPTEYRRVVSASVMGFGILAIITVLLKQDISRGYLAIAFPMGLVGLLCGRKLLRAWLASRRQHGLMSTNVLVIGGPRSAEAIDRYFRRHPLAGFHVTGVWVPDEPRTQQRWLHPHVDAVPVLGSDSALVEALVAADAGAVIVTDTEHLGHHGLKELTWELQALDIDLMVSPHLVDVATPRIELRPVGSMLFLHLEKPRFEGATRLGKTLFDKVFATAAIVGLSPVFVLAALAVKITSGGPVLYRSERIGVGGEPFEMLKFRSMHDGADRARDALTSENEGLLFKIRDDPRVTRVGKFMRRYSIDELPQLFNVIRGDMSIVGPRPPLRVEVEQYDELVHRRLLVKQGLTGLWQVSGRSDLAWEDAVRLDLDYVENWSLVRDVQIIWRTLRAVVRRSGAY